MTEYYPKWICRHCGMAAKGSREVTVATWHPGVCEVCKLFTMVTEPRDYGHPDFFDLNEKYIQGTWPTQQMKDESLTTLRQTENPGPSDDTNTLLARKAVLSDPFLKLKEERGYRHMLVIGETESGDLNFVSPEVSTLWVLGALDVAHTHFSKKIL